MKEMFAYILQSSVFVTTYEYFNVINNFYCI